MPPTSIEQLQRAVEVAQAENRPEDADSLLRMIAARRLEEEEHESRTLQASAPPSRT
jgi:hypothetical protein